MSPIHCTVLVCSSSFNLTFSYLMPLTGDRDYLFNPILTKGVIMTKKNRNNGIFKSVKISIGTMSTVLETSANIVDSLAELVTIQLQALIEDSKASAIKDSGLHLIACIRELSEEYEDILENEKEYVWPVLIATLNKSVKQLQIFGKTDTEIEFTLPTAKSK